MRINLDNLKISLDQYHDFMQNGCPSAAIGVLYLG